MANGNFDQTIIEELNAASGTGGFVNLDQVVIEELNSTAAGTAYMYADQTVIEMLVSKPKAPGPTPIFPTLPYGFPVNVTPQMKTTIGTNPSDREMRANNQLYPLWNIELLFEELRDQTQNQIHYQALAGYTQYMQLCQLWLVMYGRAGIFSFDCPWDDSRENQQIGVGDGVTYGFTVYRTWGVSGAEILEPVGLVNQIFNVLVNGITVNPSQYFFSRNMLYFIDSNGLAHPPANNAVITMSFSFYYLCRFIENDQDFEEFFKNRWTVKNLKFQSIIWPDSNIP